MSLTKAQLEKLSKPDLIDHILKNSITKEFISNLESRIAVSEKVTDLLSKKVKQLEKDLYTSQQYSRRECLEIAGIPEVDDSTLTSYSFNGSTNLNGEDKVCDLLSNIGVKIDPNSDIQACHRIKNRKIIVKFSNRKTVHQIFVNKKKLKTLDSSDLKFKPSGKIFINESLCPHFRKLLGRCIRLNKAHKIHRYKTVNGFLHVQVNQNGNFKKLEHEDDLKEMFPGYDFEF